MHCAEGPVINLLRMYTSVEKHCFSYIPSLENKIPDSDIICFSLLSLKLILEIYIFTNCCFFEAMHYHKYCISNTKLHDNFQPLSGRANLVIAHFFLYNLGLHCRLTIYNRDLTEEMADLPF